MINGSYINRLSLEHSTMEIIVLVIEIILIGINL